MPTGNGHCIAMRRADDEAAQRNSTEMHITESTPPERGAIVANTNKMKT
jgi:hypothetical protein